MNKCDICNCLLIKENKCDNDKFDLNLCQDCYQGENYCSSCGEYLEEEYYINEGYCNDCL